MLLRHRQLLAVVALLSWVTPALPEELEKKKKKHHHHHHKHHVAEDANGTVVVNRSSGEKHKHSHHRAALAYPGNSSVHPPSSNGSARLAGDSTTHGAAHAKVATSAPPRTVTQPAVAHSAVEATTSAPTVARRAAEAAQPVRHAAAPARATAAAESAAKPTKVAAAGRGAAASAAAAAEPTKALAATHAGMEPAKAAAPTRASAREASAATHPVAKPFAAAETPAPKRKALAATTAAVARAASPKAKESKKTGHKKLHSAHKAPQAQHSEQGQIVVGGPLPPDFEERFVQGVVQATGVSADLVKVLSVQRSKEAGGDTDELTFSAPRDVVEAVQDQASDPESKLAKGVLHIFLIDRSADSEDSEQRGVEAEAEEEAQPTNFVAHGHSMDSHREGPDEEDEKEERMESDGTPVQDNMIDIDTEMPYGDLEPFGREDTAQELTDNSIRESDEMVDQLERAEVAEEKRAVFRALTRLRGAAITSFDGIARSQTGNIDEYNKRYKWRESHPLHHLADEESDVNKWAFPEGEDC